MSTHETNCCPNLFLPQYQSCDDVHTGDAYRFTLQPIFRNLRHQFRCHIRHQKPEHLYQLWFYIRVNGTGFETPRIHHEIRCDDLANLTDGRFQMEFLTVEHSSGMNLHEELMLVGHQTGEHWNHTVYALGDENGEHAEKRFTIEPFLPNIGVLTAQFRRPFDYSSSTWVDGNCNKDVKKFVPAESVYSAWSQGVHVVTKTRSLPYEYLLKSPEKPPQMKFTIPGMVHIYSLFRHVLISFFTSKLDFLSLLLIK